MPKPNNLSLVADLEDACNRIEHVAATLAVWSANKADPNFAGEYHGPDEIVDKWITTLEEMYKSGVQLVGLMRGQKD